MHKNSLRKKLLDFNQEAYFLWELHCGLLIYNYSLFFSASCVSPCYQCVFEPWLSCRLDRAPFEVVHMQTLSPVSYCTCLLTVHHL